jgi:hypothetical protein
MKEDEDAFHHFFRHSRDNSQLESGMIVRRAVLIASKILMMTELFMHLIKKSNLQNMLRSSFCFAHSQISAGQTRDVLP